jgi:hypothetical protein
MNIHCSLCPFQCVAGTFTLEAFQANVGLISISPRVSVMTLTITILLELCSQSFGQLDCATLNVEKINKNLKFPG